LKTEGNHNSTNASLRYLTMLRSRRIVILTVIQSYSQIRHSRNFVSLSYVRARLSRRRRVCPSVCRSVCLSRGGIDSKL